MKKSTSPLIALSITGALLLAACGSSDAASDADPCDAAAAVSDAFAAGDLAGSEEEALEALDSFASALEDFAKVAPDEIKAEAELLADGTRKLAEADISDPSEEVLAIVDGEDYDAAGEKLEDYVQGTCGLDFG